MKKLFSILLVTAIIFNANIFVSYASTEDADYLTAEKMADNEYMTALLNELLYVDVEETTNNKYEIKNIGIPYRTIKGEEIYISFIVENIFNSIHTPNGTNVNSSTTNSSYTKRFVGMCDYLDAADIVARLNSGELLLLEQTMDSRIIEDLKVSQSVYFENYDENYNYLRDATGAYNCHSYAWYSQSSDNDIWLESPEMYYASHDQSYRQLESTEVPRVGDIIVYMEGDTATHSGIIVGFTDATTSDGKGDAHKYIVESKWGFAGLYRHKGNECSYYDIDKNNFNVVYYRLQSDSQLDVTNGNAEINVTESVSARTDDNIDSKEERNFTCELDMNQNGPQIITVSSSAALSLKLMDSNRTLCGLNYNESFENGVYQYVYSGTFADGIYYIRAEFTNDAVSGDITVNVAHQHAYTYVPKGSLGHMCICSCGYSHMSGHVIKASVPGQYKPCAFCGYLVDTGAGGLIPGIKKVTAAGTTD